MFRCVISNGNDIWVNSIDVWDTQMQIHQEMASHTNTLTTWCLMWIIANACGRSSNHRIIFGVTVPWDLPSDKNF